MRIAIDVQAIIQQKSGIGQYAEALTRHLDQRRHTYFFLKPERNRKNGFPAFAGNDVKRAGNDRERAESDSRRDLNTLQRICWEAVQFPYEAKKINADLIHTVGFSAPLVRSCKVVSTVHDLIGKVFSSRSEKISHPERSHVWRSHLWRSEGSLLNLGLASRFYWRHWLPYSFKRADHIIASSEHTKKDILRLLNYPDKKISVIPLAADERFKKIDPPSHVIPAKAGIHDFILYVGTLEPRKNLKNLIMAYSMLSQDMRKSYPLIVIGKVGWGTSDLSALGKSLGVEKDIHFMGYVPTEELVWFYNEATLFVYPSLYEGFGLPLLEAMSCGTPVISSNVSSIPEVTGDAALLINPTHPSELADAMKSVLLDSSLQQKLSRLGLERARAFSWERVAKLTTEVYESVV